MKSAIGQFIGLERPIKESSEIKDKDLDRIIEAFTTDLAGRENDEQREAA